MKLLIDGMHCGDCVRSITKALLKLDIGARVNVSIEDRLVRIEGRLSLEDAMTAIRMDGFEINSIVDGTIMDTNFRIRRMGVVVV